MGSIFAGLVLVLFDFYFNIGSHSFNILPTFLGYLLILRGMSAMEGCALWRKNDLVIGALIYSVAHWLLLALVGGKIAADIILILGLAAAVLQLLVTRRIAKGFLELEKEIYEDKYGERLMGGWKLLVIATVGANLLLVLGLSAFAVIINFVGAVLYLICFGQAWKWYKDNRPRNA